MTHSDVLGPDFVDDDSIDEQDEKGMQAAEEWRAANPPKKSYGRVPPPRPSNDKLMNDVLAEQERIRGDESISAGQWFDQSQNLEDAYRRYYREDRRDRGLKSVEGENWQQYNQRQPKQEQSETPEQTTARRRALYSNSGRAIRDLPGGQDIALPFILPDHPPGTNTHIDYSSEHDEVNEDFVQNATNRANRAVGLGTAENYWASLKSLRGIYRRKARVPVEGPDGQPSRVKVKTHYRTKTAPKVEE